MSIAEDSTLVLTPTVARFFRRALFGIAISSIILVIAVVGLSALQSGGSDLPLDPASAAPSGAKAVVEVLRHEGVDVTITESLDDTVDAIDDPSSTTLVLYDLSYFLTEEQDARLADLADTIVLIDPTFEALEALAPAVANAGVVDTTLTSDCSVTAVTKAKTVTGSGSGYRVVDDSANATACLGSGNGVYSLVQVDNDGKRVVVLGASAALSNGVILDNGNAALALNLLGANESLVWYTPTTADPTTTELSPDWVVPVSMLAVLTGIVAALWRGRRLGPLVVENLPVTVKASETMHGRARLYQQASARLHTLDSLRIGTVDRLAKAVGLPTLATITEIVDAVAAASGTHRAEVRRLLVDADPATDAELIELSDALLTLEALVARRTKPE